MRSRDGAAAALVVAVVVLVPDDSAAGVPGSVSDVPQAVATSTAAAAAAAQRIRAVGFTSESLSQEPAGPDWVEVLNLRASAAMFSSTSCCQRSLA